MFTNREEFMSNKNSEIKKAIDTFDTETARSLLREALKEANAETYYLASLVALDDEQKNNFLKKAVELDPFHEKSHASLKGISTSAPSSVITTPKKEINSDNSQSSAPASDINQFIMATVQSESDSIAMNIIPIETGFLRTQLHKGSQVLLIERDEQAEWFLCGYLSPIGQPVIGWIMSQFLFDINFKGNKINVLDLPITRFTISNTRADVQKLIVEKKRKKKNIPPAIPTSATIGLVVGVIVLMIFMISIFNDKPYLGCGIPFLLEIVAVIYIRTTYKENFNSFKENHSKLAEEINRLNLLQKDMRNEYEIMRDDQRINLGIQAGLDTAKNLVGIAGNTVAQKILTSDKSKSKKR